MTTSDTLWSVLLYEAFKRVKNVKNNAPVEHNDAGEKQRRHVPTLTFSGFWKKGNIKTLTSVCLERDRRPSVTMVHCSTLHNDSHKTGSCLSASITFHNATYISSPNNPFRPLPSILFFFFFPMQLQIHKRFSRIS